MEINHIQNIYRPHMANGVSRAKKTTEESFSAVSEARGSDMVAISSEASFRASLNTHIKSYAAQSTASAAPERLQELRAAYQGDRCPVAGIDIAAAVVKSTLGTAKNI
ncbi:MAG: hypothetical protein RSC86_06390 [Oscillospiraceae bacterium]